MDEPRRSRDARDARPRDSPSPEDDDTRVGKRPRYDSPHSNGAPPRERHSDDHYRGRDMERRGHRGESERNGDDTNMRSNASPGNQGTLDAEEKPRRKSASNTLEVDEKPRRRFKVLLANLPYDVTDFQVKNFFDHKKVPVERVRLLGFNPVKNQCNGNAFVYVKDERSLDLVNRMDGALVNGRSVRIYEYNTERTACIRCTKGTYEKEDIQALFKGLSINDIRLAPARDPHPAHPGATTWFVDFADDDSFENALCVDRTRDGLFVCVAVPNGKSPSFTPNRDRDNWRSSNNNGNNRFGDRDARPRDPPYAGRGPTNFDRYRGPPSSGGAGGPGSYRDSRDRYPQSDYRDGEYGRDEGARSGPSNNNSRFNERDAPFAPRSRDGREAPRNPEFDRDRGYPRRDEPPYAPRHLRDRHDRYERRPEVPARAERPPGEGYGRDGFRGRREIDRQPRDSRAFREREWDGPRGRDRFGDRGGGGRDYNYNNMHRDRRDQPRIKKPYDPSTLPAERPDYFTPLIDSAVQQAERFIGDVEEDLTIVISSLHFHDDRGYMSQQIRASLESVHPDINIRWIFPAGRRCGHCFVVFKDKQSRDLALSMRMVSVFDRPANVHPLEKPFLVRFHKLPHGITPGKVAEELKTDFNINGISHAPDFGEFSFFRCAHTSDFVRLLSVDGFPHKCNRLVSVSYYQGKRPYSADKRGGKRGFDGDDRRGNGRRDYNDRSHGDDGRGGRHPGSGGGGGGGNEGNGDANGAGGSTRYNDAGASRREWRVRLGNLPENFDTQDVAAFLEAKGIKDIGIEKEEKEENTPASAIIRGLENDYEVYSQVLDAEGPYEDDKGNKVAFVHTVAMSPIMEDDDTPKEKDGSTSDKNKSKRKSDTSEIEPIYGPKTRKESDNDKRGTKRPASSAGERTVPKKLALSAGPGKVQDMSPITPPTPAPKSAPATPPPVRTPSPGSNADLPKIAERFESVKAKILSDEFPNNSFCFEDFMGDIHKNRQAQPLVHTLQTDNDVRVQRIWQGKGKTGNGDEADMDGYLVWRSCTREITVKKILKRMPDTLDMKHRVAKDHPGFRHIIHHNATVVLVRASEAEEEQHLRTPKHTHKKPSSQSIVQGIINRLKEHKKVGLVRYTSKDGSGKFAALCIPPDPEIFDTLNIPWRWRDLVGHDSLMVVIGRKARSNDLREAYGLKAKEKKTVTKKAKPTLRSVGLRSAGIAKKSNTNIVGSAGDASKNREKNAEGHKDSVGAAPMVKARAAAASITTKSKESGAEKENNDNETEDLVGKAKDSVTAQE